MKYGISFFVAKKLKKFCRYLTLFLLLFVSGVHGFTSGQSQAAEELR
jgi:hypothetical protein